MRVARWEAVDRQVLLRSRQADNENAGSEDADHPPRAVREAVDEPDGRKTDLPGDRQFGRAATRKAHRALKEWVTRDDEDIGCGYRR